MGLEFTNNPDRNEWDLAQGFLAASLGIESLGPMHQGDLEQKQIEQIEKKIEKIRGDGCRQDAAWLDWALKLHQIWRLASHTNVLERWPVDYDCRGARNAAVVQITQLYEHLMLDKCLQVLQDKRSNPFGGSLPLPSLENQARAKAGTYFGNYEAVYRKGSLLNLLRSKATSTMRTFHYLDDPRKEWRVCLSSAHDFRDRDAEARGDKGYAWYRELIAALRYCMAHGPCTVDEFLETQKKKPGAAGPIVSGGLREEIAEAQAHFLPARRPPQAQGPPPGGAGDALHCHECPSGVCVHFGQGDRVEVHGRSADASAPGGRVHDPQDCDAPLLQREDAGVVDRGAEGGASGTQGRELGRGRPGVAEISAF